MNRSSILLFIIAGILAIASAASAFTIGWFAPLLLGVGSAALAAAGLILVLNDRSSRGRIPATD